MSNSGYILFCLALLAATLGFPAHDAQAGDMADGFESGRLDQSKWFTRDVRKDQISFPSEHRCGKKSVAITVRDGDGGANCDGTCQRAEVRNAKALRPSIYEEAWYGFSFRIIGDGRSFRRIRHVIGQWKFPNDGSPFVAQRMDNGVFYVTVEDNGVRRIIAKSRGSVDRLKRLQNILSGLDHDSDTDVAAVVGLQDLSEARSAALEILKSKKKNIAPFSDSLQVLEKTPVLGSGVQAAHPDTLANLMGEMTFVPEIEPYLGHADIEIEPGETNLLPDPRAGWVDMVYRIKPGRADNVFGPVGKGEVEIWANGKHIVKVRGNLGNQLLKPPEKKKVYFKFGIYRDTTPGVLTLEFDQYKQGTSYGDVKVNCD